MYAQNAKTETPGVSTINDRLNKIAETFHYQCERIEAVLSRVNGTPQTIQKGQDAAQIRPMHAMAQVVEQMEQTSQRLSELAGNVERIA